ncbi:MAG: 5-oxoprolinase, partial [Bacillota bacterium]
MDAPADARRCAVDIGGTFTDLVLVDTHTGSLYIEKTPTTPDNLWTGIADGLRRAQVDAAALAMLVHGTTVGLNTFLEKKGAPVGLITTAGFRDVYEIGRVNRIDMYDLFYRKPEPLVPREHRLEVRERIGPAGEVIEPLVEDDVRAAADHFRRHGIRAIAVCLLHSYANPAHEERVAALLEEYYPEAQVSVSNRLAREWREYERTSTTVINAYIAPRVSAYLAEMEAGLAGMGYRR